MEDFEVAMVFRMEDKKKLLKMIDEWDNSKKEPSDYPSYTAKFVYDLAYKTEDDGYLILHWNCIKWGSVNTGYKFFIELGRNQKIRCDYVCLGEDIWDNEEHYGLDSLEVGVETEMHIEQHIVLNLGDY